MVTLPVVVALVVCVLGLAAGQVMLKLAATRLAGVSDLLFSPILLAALILYGGMSVIWLVVLRQVDLSKAYPFVALTFVVVPLASVRLLGETVSPRYWAGVALILTGIVIASKS